MECVWSGEVLGSLLKSEPSLLELVDAIPEKVSNAEFLDNLARLALDPRWTESIFATYEPLLVELCNRLSFGIFQNVSALRKVSAISRVLSVAPYLSVYIEELTRNDKVGEFAALSSPQITSLSELQETSLDDLLVTLVRLLEFDHRIFAPLIVPANVLGLLNNKRVSIRYLSLKVLCLYLRSAESYFHDFAEKVVAEALPEGPFDGHLIDYRFYGLWEAKRLRALHATFENAGQARSTLHRRPDVRTIHPNDLCGLTKNFEGVLFPSPSTTATIPSLLLTTETTRCNVQKVATALRSSASTLVVGALGSGKSCIIRDIARKLDRLSSMLTLHLNEQVDPKTLVGFHTSANGPGSFQWQEGILTAAIRKGNWVLLEDIDQAPYEVISMLLPLLERAEFFVSNVGGFIRPASGFKLIATTRSLTFSNTSSPGTAEAFLGIEHWNRVELDSPNASDYRMMLQTRLPNAAGILDEIISLFLTISETRISNANNMSALTKLSKPISLHDLMRFCSRLKSSFLVARTNGNDSSGLNYEDVFLEAVDCFATAENSTSSRASLISLIAQHLRISSQHANFCVQARVPEFRSESRGLRIGRIHLEKNDGPAFTPQNSNLMRMPFASTSQVLRYLESVCGALRAREPILLVGETGTGKTTLVQEVAHSLHFNLVVVNLSQQSEASDLLGGLKPVSLRALAMPIIEDFEGIFDMSFSTAKNEQFLKAVRRSVRKEEWVRLIKLWKEALAMFDTTYGGSLSNGPNARKRRKMEHSKLAGLRERWTHFKDEMLNFEKQAQGRTRGPIYSFVESKVVKAVRNGDWVLLDEINMAPLETLEAIADMLSWPEDETPSVLLAESHQLERVKAHPNFRILAAMNPATDVGKRDLPIGIRSRFTEIFLHPYDQDLESILPFVQVYLESYLFGDPKVAIDAAKLYLSIKDLENGNQLSDGADQTPHFSLRTLTRTLIYARDVASIYGIRRALFEGFSMSFLTLLSQESTGLLSPLVREHLLGDEKEARVILKRNPRCPGPPSEFIQFRHHWIARGPSNPEDQPNYIITPFIETNLLNLVRATSTRRYPVLLQGPTSSGKTSMVEYLAKISGHKFVRINNHEHTDLQEYLGTYVSTPRGLHFEDGALVKALREGHWVVLDELNLAPTDILEALNRLLDDNRELVVPETQENIRPHSNFMLFATQNPAGLYGGRKVLSRAFRNRFLELHFDEIPEDQLEVILRERTQIAPSHCALIVKVYKTLAILRQSNRLLEQRNSFATLRDLFRWAMRGAESLSQLAVNGFMLIGERVRNPKERQMVKETIENVMRVKIDEAQLYSFDDQGQPLNRGRLGKSIVWTRSMRRLFTLVSEALQNNEPVLLVGGTGCGKTTICQVVAEAMNANLNIINAQQNMETGDIVGSQRPLRNRHLLEAQLYNDLKNALSKFASTSSKIESNKLKSLLDAYTDLPIYDKEQLPQGLRLKIHANSEQLNSIFEWYDGSLVQAMKNGHQFLLDEISLADDSVLERLNSVLEPDRTILLVEKGSDLDSIQAKEGFQFMATMNPSGDYGKRELSPALRNRFTEIWVPQFSDQDEVVQIAKAKLKEQLTVFAEPLVAFASWFVSRFYGENSTSIREILTWVNFMNKFSHREPPFFVYHGAATVFIDTIGADPTAKSRFFESSLKVAKKECLDKLDEIFQMTLSKLYNHGSELHADPSVVRFGDFIHPRLSEGAFQSRFHFESPTTLSNSFKVFRALQISKPILLEGSPGVGKTALIVSLAELIGTPLTRINLSDQTDLMDLFGSDVPVEDGQIGHFAWSDGPFLKAMRQGEWVLLDEMNLASQPVLEGLNACFDHRGEIFIPELDQTFPKHPNFTLFATQNPQQQGGGRKGLPDSFVNRFSVVYADALTLDDYSTICYKLYPNLDQQLIKQVLSYVIQLTSKDSSVEKEVSRTEVKLNLRDILRWLSLLDSRHLLARSLRPYDFFSPLLLSRVRQANDLKLIQHSLTDDDMKDTTHSLTRRVGLTDFQCGHGALARNKLTSETNFPNFRPDSAVLESMMLAIQQRWPCLLIGESSSGKSQSVQYLASLSGAELVTLNLHPEVDTTDLAGGYEQFDYQRHISLFAKSLNRFAKYVLMENLLGSSEQQICLHYHLLLKQDTTIDLHGIKRALAAHQHINPRPDIIRLHKECTRLLTLSSLEQKASFEWVDGILVQAIESGQWLVLDHANLCSSSVLDRLNYLLEPDGRLILSEHQRVGKSPRIVTPHPNFRIFLLMNPRYGELSQAMRNRCLEIFLSKVETKSNTRSPFSFLDCSSSRFDIFSQFDWNTLSSPKTECLLSLCLDNLTVHDLQYLLLWENEVSKGLFAIPFRARRMLRILVKTYTDIFFENGGTGTRIVAPSVELLASSKVAEERQPDDWVAQFIHPLNNPPMLSSLTGTDLKRKVLSATAFDLNMKISRLRNLISATSEGSEPSIPPLDSLKLQESLSTKQGGREKTVIMGKLSSCLESMMYCTRQWLKDGFRGLCLKDVPEAIVLLEELVTFVYDIFDMLVNALDIARLRVYAEIGRKICQGFSSKSGLDQPSLDFEKLVASFGEQQLKTGTSMKILWDKAQPVLPLAKQSLIIQENFERFADRVDLLLRQNRFSSSFVSRTMQELQRAHRDLLQDGSAASSLLQDLEEALTDQKISNCYDCNELHGLFKPSFECLCQCLTPSAIDGKLAMTDFKLIDFFAGRTLKTALFKPGTTFSKVLVKDIPSFFGSGDAQLSNLRQMFAPGFFGILHHVNNVPLSNLGVFVEQTRELGYLITEKTSQLLEDPRSLLACMLCQLISELFKAHQQFFTTSSLHVMIDFIDDLWHRRSGEVPTMVTTPGCVDDIVISTFNYVSERYIRPSLNQLAESLKSQESGLLLLALSCLNLFSGLVFLMVPDKPLDPALGEMVHIERWKNRAEELQLKIAAFEIFEQATENCTTAFRIALARDNFNQLGPEPKERPISRPSVSRLEDLQSEFLNILLVTKSIDSIAESSFSLGTDSRELRLAQSDLDKCIGRLMGYMDYRDIVQPIIGVLTGLKMGSSILEIAKFEEKIGSYARQQEIEASEYLGINLMTLGAISNLDEFRGVTRSMDPNVLQVKRAILERSVSEHCSEKFLIQAQDALHTLYCNWKDRLELDQAQHTKNASLYTYTKTDNSDPTKKDDHDIHELFLGDLEDSRPYGPNVPDAEVTPQRLGQLTASLHRQLVEENVDSVSALMSFVEDYIFEYFERTTVKEIVYFPLRMEQMLPCVILHLHKLRGQLFSPRQTPKNLNFYAESNLSQVSRILEIVLRIRERFCDLGKKWSDNTVISDVTKSAEELLKVPYSASLSTYLAKAENLHSCVYEWQLVSSREFTASSEYEHLTSLLVDWRRLELSSWERLLDLEDQKINQAIQSWWFVAYEAIISPFYNFSESELSSNSYLVSLVGELRKFVDGALLGEFLPKLELIRSFQSYSKLLSASKPVYRDVQDVLATVISYYERFKPGVSEALRVGRESLKKEIEEVILLASWKDANIEALRDSAQRSHRKLFRIIRKYRDLLARPSDNVQPQILALDVSPLVPKSWSENFNIGEEIVGGGEPSLFDLPMRYRNIRVTTARLGILHKRPGTISVFVEKLQSLSIEIADTIIDLKEQTPRKLSKENTAELNHLRNMKRRAFADVLKLVSNMGFRNAIDAVSLALLTNGNHILATMPMDSRLLAQDQELFGFLDNMDSIRTLAKKSHAHLTGNEVRRSVGSLECILKVITSSRRTLIQALRDLDTLESQLNVVLTLSSFHDASSYRKQEELQGNFSFHSHRLSWLNVTLSAFQTIAGLQQDMARTQEAAGVEYLEAWRRESKDLLKGLGELPTIPSGFTSTAHENLYANCDDLFDKILKKICHLQKSAPERSYIWRNLQSWLMQQSEMLTDNLTESLQKTEVLPKNPPNKDSHATKSRGLNAKAHSAIMQELVTLLDMVLANAQTANDYFKAVPQSSDEYAWLRSLDTSLTKFLSRSRMNDVSSHLDQIVRKALELGNEDSQLMLAQITRALPIIIRHKSCIQDYTIKYKDLYAGYCGLARVLSNSLKTILRDGFCEPDPRDNGAKKGSYENETQEEGESAEGSEDLDSNEAQEADASQSLDGNGTDGKNERSETQKDNRSESSNLEGDAMSEDHGDGEGDNEEQLDPGEGSDSDSDVDDEVGEIIDEDTQRIDEKFWDDPQPDAVETGEVDKATGSKKRATEHSNVNPADENEEDTLSDQNPTDEISDVLHDPEENHEGFPEEADNLNLPDDLQLDPESRRSSISESGGDENSISHKMESDAGEEDPPGDLETRSMSSQSAEQEHEDGTAVSPSNLIDPNSEPTEAEPRSPGMGLGEERSRQALAPDMEIGTNAANDTIVQAPKLAEETPDTTEAMQNKGLASQRNAEHDSPDQDTIDNDGYGHSEQDKVPQQDKEQELLQKLGNALEKWRRTKREIRQASRQDDQKIDGTPKAQKEDASLEHIPDEEAGSSLQALGASNEENNMTLDQKGFDAEEDMLMQDDFGDSEPNQPHGDDLENESAQGHDRINDNNLDGLGNSTDHLPFASTQQARSDVTTTSDRSDEMDDIDHGLSTVDLMPMEVIETKLEDAQSLWVKLEDAMKQLSQTLTQDLRMILEPTQATKMRGDFRTGKRLNIKRIIPYIASDFKRDKIWMRRAVPSKRNYQIMLAVDDSRSMMETGSGHMALQTLALVTRSLNMLEAGQVSVVSFGKDVRIVHPFGQQFSLQSGVHIVQQFKFEQSSTDIRKLVTESLEIFREARSGVGGPSNSLWQLQIIISDGVCEAHNVIRRLVRRVFDERIVPIFVILDSAKDHSITEMTQASFEPDETGNVSLHVKRYLDGFPFRYYVIVREVRELPQVLCSALRQWFAWAADAGIS